MSSKYDATAPWNEEFMEILRNISYYLEWIARGEEP
jgi:hypothetical protein